MHLTTGVRAGVSHDAARWPSHLMLGAACAYVVVAPNVGIYYPALTSFGVWRHLQLVLLTLTAGTLAFFPGAGEMLHPVISEIPRRARLALAAVVILGVTSALLAARPLYGLREVALITLLACMAISLAGAVRHLGPSFHYIAAQAISLSALFYVIIFLTELFADPWRRSEWSPHQLLGFPTPRFFGHFQSWALPLIVLPLLDKQAGPWTRVRLWIAAGGAWLLVLVSGSRAPIVTVALALVGVAVVFGPRALPWVRAHTIALAGGVAAYHLIPGVAAVSTLSGAVARGASNNGRFAMWSQAFALMRDSPWLGAGPEHFAFYRRSVAESPAHPHNTPLQWASEWGIPAALLLCGVLVWGLWSWTKACRRDDRRSAGEKSEPVSIALTGALFAGAAHSCIDGLAVMPLPQTFAALIVGWALGVHFSRQHAPVSSVATAKWLWVVRVGVQSALFTLGATMNLPVKPLEPGEMRAPRFWIHGGIP